MKRALVVLMALWASGIGNGDEVHPVSCQVDTKATRTAQEKYREVSLSRGYAGSYDELVSLDLYSEPSRLHTFVAPGVATVDSDSAVDGIQSPPYDILVSDPQCGTPGHYVGQTDLDI